MGNKWDRFRSAFWTKVAEQFAVVGKNHPITEEHQPRDMKE